MMHFEASYERTRRKSKSKSRPVRPPTPPGNPLRRAASFSNARPSTKLIYPAPVPIGYHPAPDPPAPARWVQGRTTITYPGSYSQNQNTTSTVEAIYSSPSSYKIPGEYPSTPPTGSYMFHNHHHRQSAPAPGPSYNYPQMYSTIPTAAAATAPRANPLDAPEVKSALKHEQRMRMLSEKRHQELLRQQILDLEIAKTSVQREQVRAEEEARNRMQRLYLLSQAQHQQQLVHHSHHRRSRSVARSTRSSRSRSRISRSRSRERSRSRPAIEFDEHRRAGHVCGRCSHRGHYSHECKAILVPHTHLLDSGPRSSAPALLTHHHGRRGRRRGSVYSEDEGERYTDVFDDESDEEEGEGWWSDGYDERPRGRGVPSDKGVLVMYTPGGGPASRRSSVRHVVA